MSYKCICCPTKVCCKSLIPSQRPANGVFKSDKIIAKSCISTPLICGGPSGKINVNGIIIGGPQIDFNASITAGNNPCITPNAVLLTNTNLTVGGWETVDLNASQYNILPGNTVNNCLFIGSDVNTMAGFSYVPKLAEVGLFEDSSWEYWNGASWMSFALMVAESVEPHTQYANTPFERVVSNAENVRFETMINMNLVKLELNGLNKFWIRMCLTTNIASIPAVCSFKLISSHTLIGPDGFTELFGKAMPTRELIFHRKLLETVNGIVPTSEDMRLKPSFFIDGISNEFVATQIDALAGIFRIPFGTATNCKIMLCIGWYPITTNVGDVDWNIEFIPIKQGTILNNLLPPGLSSSTLQNIGSTTGINGELMFTTFEVPILTLVPLELIAIKIFRNGPSAQDTYTSSAVIADVSANVKVWY